MDPANSMDLSPSAAAASCAATQEISRRITEPEVLLPRSQVPLAGSYHEPDQSSPYHSILSLKDSS
jgi:hypothetical protein